MKLQRIKCLVKMKMSFNFEIGSHTNCSHLLNILFASSCFLAQGGLSAFIEIATTSYRCWFERMTHEKAKLNAIFCILWTLRSACKWENFHKSRKKEWKKIGARKRIGAGWQQNQKKNDIEMLEMARWNTEMIYIKYIFTETKRKKKRKKWYARHDTKTENNAFDDDNVRDTVCELVTALLCR